MRFYLEFELRKACLPIEYRRIFLSYIKHALQNSNGGKYYENYYRDTIQKDFTFTVALMYPEFQKDQIVLKDTKVKMFFSTLGTSKTGLILFNAFLIQKYKTFPLPEANAMTLKAIKQIKPEVIKSDKVIFKTGYGSSLCVREHIKEGNKDQYYTIQDENFIEKLKYILKKQAVGAGFTENVADELIIKPISCKKVVVKNYGAFIDGTVGMFQVQANADFLQYLYDVGFGSRTSHSFGYMDLVAQDLF